jgi:hypothetical protein
VIHISKEPHPLLVAIMKVCQSSPLRPPFGSRPGDLTIDLAKRLRVPPPQIRVALQYLSRAGIISLTFDSDKRITLMDKGPMWGSPLPSAFTPPVPVAPRPPALPDPSPTPRPAPPPAAGAEEPVAPATGPPTLTATELEMFASLCRRATRSGRGSGPAIQIAKEELPYPLITLKATIARLVAAGLCRDTKARYVVDTIMRDRLLPALAESNDFSQAPGMTTAALATEALTVLRNAAPLGYSRHGARTVHGSHLWWRQAVMQQALGDLRSRGLYRRQYPGFWIDQTNSFGREN